MTREGVFRAVFFAVFAFLAFQLLKVFSPFFPAFLWAATLTLTFYPFHAALRTRMRWSGPAALLSTLAVLMLVILPLLAGMAVMVRESVHLYPSAKQWLASLRQADMETLLPPALQGAWRRLDLLLEPAGVNLEDMLLSNLDAVSGAIARAAAAATRQVFLWTVNFLLMAITLFFSFRHGHELLRWSIDLIPMEESHKQSIVSAVADTFVAVVRGLLANAVLQGLLAGLGFALAGVPFPVFFGAASAFASLVPALGAFLVWGPASLTLLARGELAGLFLAAWGSLVLWWLGRRIRNLVAPPLAGTPNLLLLFSILGGVRVYGLNGIILGPLVMASILSFVKIYREEYHHGAEARRAASRRPSTAG